MENVWSVQNVLDILGNNLRICCPTLQPPFVQFKHVPIETQQTFKDEFLKELEILSSAMSYGTKICFSSKLGNIRGGSIMHLSIADSKSSAMYNVLSKLPNLNEEELYAFLKPTTLWVEFLIGNRYKITQVSPWIKNMISDQ